MLHRFSKEGLICITQPNHAWVSGQLAQAWGNETFGQFAPREEVCLGAQQHDIGWLPWEAAPTLNPQTGYPYKFTELSTQVHIGIWSNAKQLAQPLGKYATLLVLLHGTGLYERFTDWKKSAESTQIVQEFLTRESAFQEQLISTLQKDAYYAPHATPEVIQRNRKLVEVWDAISLIICQRLSGEQQISHVPTAEGETTLKLMNTQDDPHEITISPWPFEQTQLTVFYEGRLLRETFSDEAAMREALMSDCWVSLRTTLKPE